MNKYKYFILIFFSVFILDQLISRGISLYLKAWPEHQEMTSIEHSYQADYLILGSSRARYHFHQKVLEKNFPEKTFFNSGRVGANLLYFYLFLEIMIAKKDKIPPNIILSFDPENFEVVLDSHKKILSRLIAFSEIPAVNQNIIQPFWHRQFFNTIFSSYKYNGRIGRFLSLHLFNYFYKPRKQDFFPQSPRDFIYEQDSTPINLNQESLNLLDKIIKLTLKYESKLIIVHTPKFLDYFIKYKEFNQKIHSISNRHSHVKFLDYSHYQKPIFKNKKLYADHNHLNRTGAMTLTQLFIKDLENL